MKNAVYRHSADIKRILFLLAIILTFALLRYSQKVVEQLRTDSGNLVRFYAEVYAKAATDYNAQDFSFIFDEIINKISVPMIISEKENSNPTAWKGVDLDEEDHSPENVAAVAALMVKMDSENQPIPLKYQEYTLGYIHYGDTKLIQKLQMLPFIEISIIALFIFIGYIGFHVIRSSEKRSIWVGMAKETAHQLGTPLTSLMGWIELLKADSCANENIDEMSKDIMRLEKVATRFSQIGSKSSFKITPINPVIQEAVDYYRRRLPQLGPSVQLTFSPDDDYRANLNADLFSWAVENLVKNALDAVPESLGKITITTKAIRHGKYIAIDVIDNGKGIPKKNRKNIFRPGYSTKLRGWGLGLSLTKRIIQEYHHGKIFVLESKPFSQTILRIVLRSVPRNV
ncbi:MAG: sensor histidine kinase [Candidatus Marinimicrobia bacterium CG08_land_8_20_14_0_20_45_22]|nr:MAG: sensor histidine kinase [Candidatus Marinimicrobia bacterium CG08_land_8_20_14_0_20_45_22]